MHVGCWDVLVIPFSLTFFFFSRQKNIIKGEGVSNRPNKQMDFSRNENVIKLAQSSASCWCLVSLGFPWYFIARFHNRHSWHADHVMRKPFWGGHSSKPITPTRKTVTDIMKVFWLAVCYGLSCYGVVCMGVCFLRVGLSRHSLVLLNWLYCTCNWKHLFLGKACCLFIFFLLLLLLPTISLNKGTLLFCNQLT